MGVSGSWAQRASVDYTGATKWGNGVNPIHAIPDNGRGRVIGTRENLYPLGQPSDAVSPGLTGREADWVCEDYVEATLPAEYYRYQEEFPRWNQTTPQFRGATNSPAMGEQPSWGVYFDDDTSGGMWPQSGPTGGMQRWLDVDHGEVEEQQIAIAVPTRFVTGGWQTKTRGAPAQPMAQEIHDPHFTPVVNTAAVQGPGLQAMSNDRAVARGTDAVRSPIQSRTAGMAEKDYARSLRMGGGSGTPDMFPFQQTSLKRPFITRQAAVPPGEPHFMNTMEGRSPMQRATAPDPYQGDPEVGAGDTVYEWGY